MKNNAPCLHNDLAQVGGEMKKSAVAEELGTTFEVPAVKPLVHSKSMGQVSDGNNSHYLSSH